MNTWYHIKRWFERSKKEIIVVKKTKNNSRKKRDNTRLTKAQIVRINLIWSGKDSPIPDVSNLTKLTKYCNDKLNINKSRSVYHRIVNSEGAYATSIEKLLDTKEVSEILGVTVKSLANSRSINTKTGLNVPYIKVGGVVRYKESAIQTYIDANSFTFTNKN